MIIVILFWKFEKLGEIILQCLLKFEVNLADGNFIQVILNSKVKIHQEIDVAILEFFFIFLENLKCLLQKVFIVIIFNGDLKKFWKSIIIGVLILLIKINEKLGIFK